MTIEELIKKEEEKLTQLTIQHNEIVEYQNANLSFYYDDEELSELIDKIHEKLEFVVTLKRKIK